MVPHGTAVLPSQLNINAANRNESAMPRTTSSWGMRTFQSALRMHSVDGRQNDETRTGTTTLLGHTNGFNELERAALQRKVQSAFPAQRLIGPCQWSANHVASSSTRTQLRDAVQGRDFLDAAARTLNSATDRRTATVGRAKALANKLVNLSADIYSPRSLLRRASMVVTTTSSVKPVSRVHKSISSSPITVTPKHLQARGWFSP